MRMRARRLCLLGVWILSLVSISMYGGAVSYGFFFGVTLLPLILLIYLGLVYWRFKLYQKIEGREMECGKPVPFFFVLQNEDYLPFVSVSVKLFSSFSYVEKMPEGVEYELLPGESYRYDTKLICRYRGEYEVGVKEILVTDFLKIFRLRYRVPETIRVSVLPKLTHVSRLNSIGNLSVLLQRDISHGDTEPDVVVRDYVAGDAWKQIHWKATAREQKLKIRNRIGEENQGIALLCDTKRYSRDIKKYLPVENKLLEVALSLTLFLTERNMGVCTYFGQDGLVKQQVEDLKTFDEFYEAVSRITYREEEDVLQTLTFMVRRGELLHSKVLFLVLHEMTEAILQLTTQLAEIGILMILYVVTEENIDSYIRQSNERRQIIAIPVEAELEGRL